MLKPREPEQVKTPKPGESERPDHKEQHNGKRVNSSYSDGGEYYGEEALAVATVQLGLQSGANTTEKA